jgi:hypothetical protein
LAGRCLDRHVWIVQLDSFVLCLQEALQGDQDAGVAANARCAVFGLQAEALVSRVK